MSGGCRHPEFVWLQVCWSACVHCGEPAWGHPQSDREMDVRNVMRILVEGLNPIDYPPTMRPAEPA